MPELIGLDFETYSAVDLRTHGLVRYTEHKTFQPLIASVAMVEDQGYNGNKMARFTLDFVQDRETATQTLRTWVVDNCKYIVPHNAPFEAAVLAQLGIDCPSDKFIDSAVVARAAGAASRLEAAAPQLLNVGKMDEGRSLIKLFCVPGKYQEANDSPVFDPQVIVDHPDEWKTFIQYCELDATLALRLVRDYRSYLTERELEYAAITMDMNRTGWCVDVPLVEEMQRRYQENQVQALLDFHDKHQCPDLNLNSLKQMKEWCADRGVKAVSFDEKHVARYLEAIEKKLANPAGLTTQQIHDYTAVESLLVTKQILGGSSLKKLRVILDTVGSDGRLRDQYVHCGAAQSLRTSGRSTQMQNLKTLDQDNIKDMSELDDVATVWDNGELAENIRQVFTASEPGGRLIVGDFSSVESRGLAYLAGEQWKLDAYRQGKKIYEMLAAEMFGVPYEDITKTDPRRQTGKVGELSCGYGAGAGAIMSFADGMGVKLTEAEADKIKVDWRVACPATVDFWALLDQMLHDVVEQGVMVTHPLPDGLRLRLAQIDTPASLLLQHPGAQSVVMSIVQSGGQVVMMRYFHGCYLRGGNVGYYKPSDRKTGDLWKNHYKDPKTKQVRFYELYGGKLAGILTQSFCRELFMESMAKVHTWTKSHSNLQLVGQFHDELVVDWRSDHVAAIPLDLAKYQLDQLMSSPEFAPSFPLAADIKDDYRYTK